MSESIEADTSVSERILRFGHAQGEQIIEDDLARLQLQAPMTLRRGRQRRTHRPGPLLALRQHGEGYAAALRAVQVEADLRELPFVPAAAIIDGQTAIGDSDFVQRLAVEAAGAGIEPQLAKLIDPGQQGGEIGCGAAFGQSLQRKRALSCGALAAELGAALPDGRRRLRPAAGSGCAARSGAIVTNGRSPPTSTLTRPSGSMRIVMLASTRRKLRRAG